MIAEKNNEFAGHVLNDMGIAIARELGEILNNSDKPLEAGLKFVLANSFAGYSPVLVNQMGLLLEEPKFKMNGKLASHFSYELSMVKNILANEKKIKKFFGGDSQLIADLVFAILISDIGKVGPMEVRDGQPSAVVRRIYNQAIFTSKHEEWLKKAKPADFPDNIKPLIERLSEEDHQTVFIKGAFFPLPLDAYMYVIKQVAIESVSGAADEMLAEEQELVKAEKIAEAEKLFTFTKEEREFLLSINVIPDELPTRSFFTNSHIRFGRIFLSRDDLLDEKQKKIVPIALSHHFSQGVLPKGMTAEIIMDNQDMLRQIIFLEILDKFDAFYCRFKDAGPDLARESTWKLLNKSLKFNYPQHPELLETYKTIFEQMVEMEII